MICPKCGKEMEPGYVSGWTYSGFSLWQAKALGFGVDWYTKDNKETERLRKASWGGEVKIDGFRCKDCRTLVLQY
ncbi:MAG: PF20097 family protein [Methanomassiliicoccales archaeon]|jgi:hypothetical protein|nr:PF20097 family protein [Methanomassiliicoccales archaeon]